MQDKKLFPVENGKATIKFLESERLYLRPLIEDDANGEYLAWLNDSEICFGNSHQIFPYLKSDASKYIQASNHFERDLILAIVLQENNKHIGNVALQRINWIYRKAEFAILIGDKNLWGKGIGLEAGKLIVNHGFTNLNLHRIECATFSNNIGMQNLALALGMKQEGVRREAAYKQGQLLDIFEYGLLRQEVFL